MATLRLWEIVSGGAWSNPANAFDADPINTSSDGSSTGVGTMPSHDTSDGPAIEYHAYGKNNTIQVFRCMANSPGNTLVTLNVIRNYHTEAIVVSHDWKFQKEPGNGTDFPVEEAPWSLGSYVAISYSWDNINYTPLNEVGSPGLNGLPNNQIGYRAATVEKTNKDIESLIIDATGHNLNTLHIKIETIGVYAESRTFVSSGPPTVWSYADVGVPCNCQLFDLNLGVADSGDPYYVPILYTNDHHNLDITPGHKVWSMDLFSTLDGSYSLANANDQTKITYPTPFQFYFGSELYTPPSITSGYYWPYNISYTGLLTPDNDPATFTNIYDEHDSYGFPIIPISVGNETASFLTSGICTSTCSIQGPAPNNDTEFVTSASNMTELVCNFNHTIPVSKFIVNATVYVCLALDLSIEEIDVVQEQDHPGFTGKIQSRSSFGLDYSKDGITYINIANEDLGRQGPSGGPTSLIIAKRFYSEVIVGVFDLMDFKIKTTQEDEAVTFWGFGLHSIGNPEILSATSVSTIYAAYITGEEVNGFKISTGGDLIHNDVWNTPSSLVDEQFLWAGGWFSYGAQFLSESTTPSQNGGGQDGNEVIYPLIGPPSLKVKIDNTTYDIESFEDGIADTYVSEGNPVGSGYRVTTIVRTSMKLRLVGHPDLSSILSIGKIIIWTN